MANEVHLSLPNASTWEPKHWEPSFVNLHSLSNSSSFRVQIAILLALETKQYDRGGCNVSKQPNKLKPAPNYALFYCHFSQNFSNCYSFAKIHYFQLSPLCIVAVSANLLYSVVVLFFRLHQLWTRSGYCYMTSQNMWVIMSCIH